MFSKCSIVFKIAAVFLFCSTVIVSVMIGYNFWVSRNTIVDMAVKHGEVLGHDTVASVAAELRPIEEVVQNIAIILEDESFSSDDVSSLLQRLISRNKTIFGMAIAFEPYGMFHDKLFYSPYSYRTKKGIALKQLGSNKYRYFFMDWYLLPKELGRPYWSEPYFDEEGGDIMLVTYSVPFYRLQNGERVFAGVVTADISLEWLQERISTMSLYESGYAVLLSQNGTFITHPKGELIGHQTIFSYAEELDDSQLWDIGRAMIDGKTGMVERPNRYNGKTSLFLYMPLTVGDWSVALLLPKDEVLAPLTAVSRNTVIIGLLGFLLLALVIINIARKITKPIRALTDSAIAIASGDLQAKVPSYTAEDEVGRLTGSFATMQESLQKYIEELTDTTIKKERIESELRIAHDIQMSILPKLFPAFPDRTEFDICATIEPAKEVGGDLYDFFFLDDENFCFLIGDVSGKGVPAAFFMAVTKTMLNIVSEQKREPGLILEKVNNDLAKDNDACMFVTLFFGILNINTGVIRYASAGHNPPVMINDGVATWLPSPREPVAGAMEGMQYSTHEVRLGCGDMIFLYTDGVTEAMNEAEELYTDPRLLDVFINQAEVSSKEAIAAVQKTVEDFVGEAEQADDITMLALKFTNCNKLNEHN